MERLYDFAPVPGNPRNSEGCFYRKRNGNILFYYSRFYAGNGDTAGAVIAAREMSPDGRYFTGEERTVFTPETLGAENVMCPSLFPLRDGRLGLIFLVRLSDAHLLPYMMYSSDEGGTFTDGHYCVDGERYLILENDRVETLPDGRILLLMSEHRPEPGGYAGVSFVSSLGAWISDDEGKTFREYWHQDHPHPESGCGLQEPGYCVLPDGKLFLFARSLDGVQWTAVAQDANHLPELAPDSRFPSPRSPMSARCLPDGRILAVWNNDPGVRGTPEFESPLGWGGLRAPLVYALSENGGNTWTRPHVLEDDRSRGYCYTGIGVGPDSVLLAYCAGSLEDGSCLSRLRLIRLDAKDLNI